MTEGDRVHYSPHPHPRAERAQCVLWAVSRNFPVRFGSGLSPWGLLHTTAFSSCPFLVPLPRSPARASCTCHGTTGPGILAAGSAFGGSQAETLRCFYFSLPRGLRSLIIFNFLCTPFHVPHSQPPLPPQASALHLPMWFSLSEPFLFPRGGSAGLSHQEAG